MEEEGNFLEAEVARDDGEYGEGASAGNVEFSMDAETAEEYEADEATEGT